MENVIKNVLAHDLMILNMEGIEYTIIKSKHMDGYDVHEIRIDGDSLYYDMALHAIRRK